MRFAHPQILSLLAVFPPLMLVFFWWSWHKRQQLITQFIQARLLSALTVGISPARLKLRLASLVLSVVYIILALARPQWGFDWEPTKQRGLDILVAIDTSKSMLAEDIAPNRLTRAKLAALDLMQQAKSDRLGLIAFAGTAFLQCPLTVDDTAFRQSVETLDVNIIPQGGTALAEVIQTAAAAFKEGDNYKALVMLTDGEDHDSGAVEAAKKAAEAGLQIFAVGIGSADGELLRIKDANGRTDYVRDEDGNVVKSHLNEDLLKDIAKETQYGIYLRLQGAKSIETLYQQGLSRLPKSEHEEKLVRQYHERYHWPLALALILLAIEMLFPERKREPKTIAPSLKPAKVLTAAAAVLVLLGWPPLVRGSTSGALREYKQGNYDQALKDYQKLLQRHNEDPRLHFNAGAAAYRDKKFDQAAKEFDAALAASDLKLQELSYYNHGNTLFQLGQQNPDPTKKTETWKGALKDFESSLKLNPQDPDAKFNYEFVKKRLEELKQQQQQQNKSDQNKQDQKDQQQQQNQQNQDSQKDKDQQQQKSEQSKSEQNKDQQNQQAQQQKQEQEKQEQQKQQQAADQSQQQKEQQQAQQQADQKPPQPQEAPEQKQTETAAAGQMTPEQARQLLDAQKSEEQLLPIKPKEKQVDRSRHFKDW